MAVAGAGAFGRNHLRVVRELEAAGEGAALVAAVEPDTARAAEAEKLYGIKVFTTIDELLKADLKLDAACVAVPTVKHHEVASALLDAGLDLLVEKPLAANLAEADDLITRAERGGRMMQPGHLERFNPAVLAVEPTLKRPMFCEAHRLSVFTPRALDVDVVLDLMIHDIDIVLAFVDSPVKEIRAVGIPILSPKVDICNVRVEFESGCVANLTASRVSTERVRKLRFFQPKQYISVDYGRQDVLVFSVGKAIAQSTAAANPKLPDPRTGVFESAEVLAARQAFSGAAVLAQAGIAMSKPAVAQEEPLKAELKAFISAVRDHSQPQVTLAEGRRALALALDILTQAQQHAEKFHIAGR